MGNEKSKDVAAAGSLSGVTVAYGVGLMFLGPVGMVVGGIAMGAGISGSVNTIQQVTNKSEKFDGRQFFTTFGVGAATGAIAAPIALVGGGIAAGVSSNVAKTAINISTGVVSGAATGTGGKIIQNKVEGKDFDDGLGTALVTGIVSGGVGASLGQATQGISKVLTKDLNTVGQLTSAGITRVTTQTVGGSLGGATGGALTKFVQNLINKGEISKQDLFNFLSQYDQTVTQNELENLWEHLKRKGLVKNNIAILKNENIFELAVKFSKFKEPLCKIISEVNYETRHIIS